MSIVAKLLDGSMALGMEVGLGPGHIVLDGDPAPLPKMGQFSAHFYCGQTAVCIRIPIGTEVKLSLGDIVLDGDPAHPPLKGHTPYCRPMSIVAKPLDGMPLGMKVDLGPGDFVFYGAQLPSEKKGTAPIQFLAHVYCGQTAGWIKMPLGTEVNLGPGDVVLDRVAARPPLP